MEKKNKAIVKPAPLSDFSRAKALYIPVDSKSLLLQKHMKKIAIKAKAFPFGSLYLFENKTILFQCIGAPLAIFSLERLIVSGTKEIVILGFCGSLNPKAKIMNAVIITKALSEEGTSRHYFSRRKTFFPSPTLRKKIELFLCDSNLSFLHGAIVSTDAPYRETKSWLVQKQNKGIDFVDMETSAVFALAEFYGIQAAALMLVSDELAGRTWKSGFSHSLLDERIKEYFFPLIER